MIPDRLLLMPALVEIKRLMALIEDPKERRELALLDVDRSSTRSDIKQRVDTIVMRQPVEVQDAYVKMVQEKIATHDKEYDDEIKRLRAEGAPPEVLEATRQLHVLEYDWSLSKQDAERLEKELIAKLGKTQRDLIDF